ncbi:hypothetical protein [Parendozoicomonas haliclonae]|uniref:Uncharacterized protein n=1 Tax=Parendozoicomonas haliclonae TaxID=1960125 RepID=A0A1X7AJW9_9GAMM|nr:hypothetical protein [Parendozoicomonas haliclonae]SMA47219.1 hypothetical protein EHSB41UT_02344 [Parendozoicomonas haliclonae]
MGLDYKLVFSGDIDDDISPELARENVSRLLKVPDQRKIELLFSGKTVVIKKGLDARQAEKYRRALSEAGLLVSIDPPLELVRDDPDSELVLEADVLKAIDQAHSQMNYKLVDSPIAPVFATDSMDSVHFIADQAVDAKESESEEVQTEETLQPRKADARDFIQPAADSDNSPSINDSFSPFTEPALTETFQKVELAQPKLDRNNSGRDEPDIPEEVRGLSWGGFWLTFIWGLFNRTYISLLALVPVVNLVIPFYLLFKGRELAWRKKHWDSFEHFQRVQKFWGAVGLVLVLGVLCTLFLIAQSEVGEFLRQHSSG